MPTFRTLLLAAAFTAGVPALAMAQDRPDDQHHGEHGDHGNRGGDNGGQRGERPAPAPVPAVQPAPAPQAQPQRQAPPPQAAPQNQRPQDFRGERGAFQGGGDRGDRRNDRFGQPDNRGGGQRPDANRDNRDNPWGPNAPGGQGGYRPDPNRGDPNRDRDRGGQFNQGRPGGPDFRGDQRPDQFRGGQFQGRPGDRPDFRGRPGSPSFAHDWRGDRRFDWRGYRDQHREIFRGPRYIAPRGWGYGYRRFEVGFRLPSFFFGEQYWISDPWSYRLPPADGPYRWVRYYNDVLLVDLRTGQVVDEIPDFFFY